MSFERKIAEQALTREVGARPDPAPVRTGGEALIKGAPVSLDQRGHQNHVQTIHQHLELRSRPLTAVYRTDGEIAPGEFGAYIMRASGSLSVTLAKPPAIPDGQRTPSGKARGRFWRIALEIFAAGDSEVSWPDGVKWGGAGTQPPNPRPAGTADMFELQYIERTGEWWVTPIALAVEALDPETQQPDTTEPPEGKGGDEDDGSEDGNPPPDVNPPEHVYTDPETGEELTPERPHVRDGWLIALHDGAVSYSGSLGANWSHMTAAPDNPDEMASSLRKGTMIRAGEYAYHALNLGEFSRISFEDEIFSEIRVPNGDFEWSTLARIDDGETKGWVTLSDDAPVISDSTTPQQRQGSTWYAARNPLATVGDYEIAQKINLSGSASGLAVRASVLARSGAQTVIGMRASVQIAGLDNLIFDDDLWYGDGGSLHDMDYTTRNVTEIGGREVEARWDLVDWSSNVSRINGRSGGNWIYGNNGSVDSVLRVSFRFRDTGEPASITGGFSLTSCDAGQGAHIEEVSGLTVEPAAGSSFPLGVSSRGGRNYIDARSQSNGGACSVILESVSQFRVIFSAVGGVPQDGIHLDPYPLAEHANATTTIDYHATSDGEGKWVDLETVGDFPDGTDQVEVYAIGLGDAFIDNIRLGYPEIAREAVRAVAYNRVAEQHVIATDEALYSFVDGERSRIADVPAQAAMLAASGDIVVIADLSGGIWLSRDNATTWTGVAVPSEPVQVIAAPRALVVCLGGQVVELSADGVTQLSTIAPGARLERSSRLATWLATSPTGAVHRSDDLEGWSELASQPVGGTEDRRTVATQDVRLIGYAEGSRDLFHSDSPADGWKQSHSLRWPILDLQELR